MKRIVAIIFISVSVYVFYSIAAADPGEDTDKPNNDSIYVELVNQIKAGSQDVDFTELRMVYAGSSFYEPYGKAADTESSMRKTYNKGEYENAIRHAKKLIEDNFLDINCHILCDLAYSKLGNSERSNYHRYIALGLLRSIAESGDGKTMESAFIVISVAEEYAHLDIMGLNMKEQALLEENGHEYDRLETEDMDTGEKVTLYFNVDPPLRWFRNELMK